MEMKMFFLIIGNVNEAISSQSEDKATTRQCTLCSEKNTHLRFRL